MTSRLLQHLGLRRPLGLYHEHNAAAARPELLARLRAGASGGAGQRCRHARDLRPGLQAGARGRGAGQRRVPDSRALGRAGGAGRIGPADRPVPVPGLPAAAQRRAAAACWTELAAVPATLVLFESPQRLADMLADAAAVLGPRPAAVGRELTKLLRGASPRHADASSPPPTPRAAPPKGEVVVVIAPPAADAGDLDDDGRRPAAARGAARRTSRAVAAAAVAAATGRTANELYRRALTLGRAGGEPAAARARRPPRRDRWRPGCCGCAAIASWRAATRPRWARSTSSPGAAISWCSSRSSDALRARRRAGLAAAAGSRRGSPAPPRPSCSDGRGSPAAPCASISSPSRPGGCRATSGHLARLDRSPAQPGMAQQLPGQGRQRQLAEPRRRHPDPSRRGTPTRPRTQAAR